MPTKPDFGPYKSADEIPKEERKYYYVMDKFRPVDSIEFVDQLVNDTWIVRLPKFLAEYHGWWAIWEKECHMSMKEHLKPGMLLYDIGAFDGWQSAMFSQMVGGPENMVLVEPVPEQWANTKKTWDENRLRPPRATFLGFAADYETMTGDGDPAKGLITVNDWPTGYGENKIDYSQIIKAIKFRLINEHQDHTAAIRIDTLAEVVGQPDALHIDVEGAELLVLLGAEKTLRTKKPLVWIAVHPEFMRDRFQTDPATLRTWMATLGYEGKLLARDHEEHWYYEPR